MIVVEYVVWQHPTNTFVDSHCSNPYIHETKWPSYLIREDSMFRDWEEYVVQSGNPRNARFLSNVKM